MKKQHTYLQLLAVVYLVASLFALLYWEGRGQYSVTGDEPHYLIIASGIVNDGSFEQTASYKREFLSRGIYKPGLAPQEAEPSPENTHAVLGPNGLYNVHNVGLPLLLILPFWLGGVLGAKLFMVALGLLAVILIWRISGVFSTNDRARFLAVLGVAVSLPLIPASGQIYPEIPAGVIILAGLYWFMTSHVARPVFIEFFWACAVVFLPWLQIKFGLVCATLVVFIVVRAYLESGSLKRPLLISMVASISCLLLMLYNYHAFGKVTGPYQADAIEFSKTALMALMGLHFDQNQGFLLQNPLLIIGLLFLGSLFFESKAFALLCILIFLMVIVPNALHPNWYGGWSFSGRFAWVAAMVFWIPAVYGLLQVFKLNRRAFGCLIAFGLTLQMFFYVQYVFMDVSLYNKSAMHFVGEYSIFYSPISRWLPSLYDSEWAFGYGVNFIWFSFLLILLIAGFSFSSSTGTEYRKLSVALLVSAGLAILITGFVSNHGVKTFTYLGKDLPSLTGSLDGSSRIVRERLDQAGFMTYGPYILLGKGKYEVLIKYTSSAPVASRVGGYDVFNAGRQVQDVKGALYGTAGEEKLLSIPFKIDHWYSSRDWLSTMYEFRIFWEGISDLQIREIQLRSF